jgi:hypothetical protein
MLIVLCEIFASLHRTIMDLGRKYKFYHQDNLLIILHTVTSMGKQILCLLWNILIAVLGIRIWNRIHRIRMFLGLPGLDPNPLVSGTDPDPDPSLFS